MSSRLRGAGQALGGEGPNGIGELDLTASERRRHGDGASAWALFQPGKIDLGGSFRCSCARHREIARSPTASRVSRSAKAKRALVPPISATRARAPGFAGFPIIGGW